MIKESANERQCRKENRVVVKITSVYTEEESTESWQRRCWGARLSQER